jgi:hypothetical protein
VPNGSGSIIRFNNGRTNAEDYRQPVYRVDPLLVDFISIDKAQPVRLPIFGIQHQGYGVLARIENGAPLAAINASVSGEANANNRSNSYNNVFAEFTFRGAMRVYMIVASGTGQSSIPVVERPKAELNVEVRYTMLTPEYDGYAGMARYERERLIREGVLAETDVSGDVPFFMDLIGSVQGRRFFGTVAYQGQIPMTTFAQAAEISQAMANAGARKQVINYQGWFNRGYYHDTADKIKPVRQLGSVKQLEQLGRDVSASGGRLYSDTIFNCVPYSAEDRGYRWIYSNSRYYGSGQVGFFGMYTNIFDYYQAQTLGYKELAIEMMSPKFLSRYVDAFLKRFGKYDIDGVSLRDLGDYIWSDRKRTNVIDRAQSEEIITANLAKFDMPLLINGGNYYSLPFAGRINGAPMSHNAYYIVDEEIPFYQIIVSGCLDYAGDAINLSDIYDERETVLKLIEFGASPRFTFTYNESSEMKNTSLAPKYSTTFEIWKDTAARIYNEVNSVMEGVYGNPIINHEVLAPGVMRTTYGCGTRITVNYNDHDAGAMGVHIRARSYLKEGAGE